MSNTTVLTARMQAVMIKPSPLNWLRVKLGTDVPTRFRDIEATCRVDHQAGGVPELIIHNPRPGVLVLRVRNGPAPGTWRILSPATWKDVTPTLGLVDTVRSWFSWRLHAIEGQWMYYENKVSRQRRVVKDEEHEEYDTALLRRTWLAGGQW